MPSKKKKYNARFPAGRIKKIMQSDEEIGKVAQAVPVIISRTLELFVESLLHKTLRITSSRNAKTLSTSHMKQCIMAEHRFDFLRELVKNIPDINITEESAIYNEYEPQSSPEDRNYPDSDTPYDLSMPSFSMQATRSVTTGDLQKFWEKSSNHMALSSRALTHGNQLLPYLSEMRALSTVNTSAAVPDVLVLSEKTAQTYERKIAQKKQFRTHLVSETVFEQHSPKATPAMATSAQSDKSIRTRDDILVEDMAKLTSLNDFVVANAKMSAHETTRKHVRQRKTSQNIASSDSSVISQTTSLSNNTQICLPLKLCGNDSATTGAVCNTGFIQLHESQSTAKKINLDQQGQLLKKESKLILSTNASTDKNYSPIAQPTLPPVPAHILSIDFYNKPVLKIDYSRLSVSANVTTSTIKPLSAPSKVSVSSEENKAEHSNFSPEPIFNIDLSNIVTSDNKMSNQPPVAKISIGTIAALPSISSNLGAVSTKLQNNISMKTNPSYISTSEQSPYAIFAERASQSALNKNSFFELDEDYDDI